MPPMDQSPDRLWQAVLERNASAAGEFVFGVTSTGIYCRVGCPSRTPRRDRVRFFVSPAAASALEALRDGAGVVVTGQQVALFGGPLFTPFKAATALARARQATAAGRPHAAIFWLATEDHDFAEINHATFPARRELRKLIYAAAPGKWRG